MASTARRLAMPLLLLVIAAGFYWRLTLTRQFSWVEQPEIAARVLPRLDLQSRLVHERRVPLWNPYWNGGVPLAGDWESGTADPLHWILFAQPLRDGHIRLGALNAWWVLVHWLAAILFYAFCRELGAGRLGAVFGATAFGLSGWFGAQWSPAWICGAVVVPAVPLAWLRWRRAPQAWTAASLMGVAVGMAWLSTDAAVGAAATALAAGLWLYGAFRGPRGAAARMAASAGIGLLVGALQLLSAAAWPAIDSSFDWRAPLGVVLPGWSGAYLGITVASFAVAGAWFLRCHGAARWLALAAALGLLLPSRATMVIAQLGMCGLAALALDAPLPARASRIARHTLVALGIAGFAFYTAIAVLRLEWDARPLLSAFIALLLAALLYARERGGISPAAASACVIALALFEAGMVAGPAMPETGRDDARLTLIRKQVDLGRYLHEQPGWFRVDANAADVPYRFGEWYGIEQVEAGAPARARLGVAYTLAAREPRPGLRDMYAGDSGVHAFRDPDALPPLHTQYDEPCNAAGHVEIEGRDAVSLVVVADMPCAGMLVAGDTYAAGWRVWIDHHPAPIVPVDGVRGVRLAAGRHRLEFRYRPTRVYAGALLTALGLALTAWLAWRERRQHAVE